MLANLAIAPASISIPASPTGGMLAWYKADAITGLLNGAAVSSWVDSSGNGYNATQGTGADQPTYKTGQLNGLPGVSFNGSSDRLLATIASTSQPVTVCGVWAPGGWGTWDGAGGAIWGFYSTSLVEEGVGSGNISASGTYSSPAYITYLVNGSSSVIRLNGSQVASGGSGTSALGTSFSMGFVETAGYFNGNMYEIIVYPSALTVPQMQATESYLNGKWFGGGGGTQQTPATGATAQAGAVGRAALI